VTEPNLFSLSLSAFVAVLMLLSLVALVIKGLALVFRERQSAEAGEAMSVPVVPPPSQVDAPLVAALHAALAHSHPHHRIVRIEEASP
jgi:Na+-transporting methylmalonyl-CoA/oxaloacetate decarboxylase gamma subunit